MRPEPGLRAAGAALLAVVLLTGCAGVRTPVEPLYPEPAPHRFEGADALVRVLPPLEHDPGGRWPLVLWHGAGFEPLSPERIRALLDRGIVQHLRLRTADIEAARRLAAADAPLVLMEGMGGAWPYDLADGEWRLAFPPDADVPDRWRRLADPTRLAGWRRAETLTRQRLERYRDAGLSVDAVWLDYEGALLHDDFRALQAATTARRLPSGVLRSERRYRDYRRRHWLHGLSRYLAAPVRRVFPRASVTNWVVMLSSTTHPVPGWTGWHHPPSPPLFFTHSNPIAYGIDTAFLSSWPGGHPVNRATVDRFFTHVLLRQVSADARNRARSRPDMGAVVWVARWVPDHPEERVPVMSRAAYREALRHIWLRGADAMQVFNPAREGFERYAIHEVQDVQRIYDEMLGYREFLERGKVMRFEVPDAAAPSVLWSGLRLGGRALVRVTRLGGAARAVTVCIDDDQCRRLAVPAEGGRTYVLRF